ncbi:hypothetical protein BGZ57DRAFT_779434, partial [Hyaloscypha finlandica]
LSIIREKEIICNLVFLSTTLDNSLNIITIYIKEYYNKRVIIIRVILNTGDLLVVNARFVKLTRVLEYTTRRDNIEVAFREVISLDLERILSRLRSRHVKGIRKTTRKRPLIV